MAKLSAVIITQNDEKLVAAAVNCAGFADAVLVVDCGSIGKTCDLAEELGARVARLGWPGSGALKNKSVGLARNDWVFVLKVNERITSELQAEILSTLQDPSSAVFMMARLGRYFDKGAIDQGLYPGYSLRLFNRQHGKFSDQPVLASVQLNGAASELKHHLTRLAYDIVKEYIATQERCQSKHYKSSEIIKEIVSPYWAFFRLYFLQRRFLGRLCHFQSECAILILGAHQAQARSDQDQSRCRGKEPAQLIEPRSSTHANTCRARSSPMNMTTADTANLP